MIRFVPVALLLTAAGAACQTPAAPGPCTIAVPGFGLATDVRETSGLARGRRNPGVLWTHNDSRFKPELFAVGEDGKLLTMVRVTGARLTDWEDIEAGVCNGEPCLFIADIGDNRGERPFITVYEVREPELAAGDVGAVRAYHARYADGPRDAEALFRLPDGGLYIVSKGRHGPIELFRFSVVDTKQPASLLPMRVLAPQPADERDRVTAATASPDGRWVAIRTYRTLWLYRTADLLGSGPPAHTVSLLPLAEKQGESVTLDDDGTVWLSSEAEDPRDRPTLARLQCTLE